MDEVKNSYAIFGILRYANFAARFIVKDLLKFFETKDDLLTLSLGSHSVFSQDKFSLLDLYFSSNLFGIS